MVIEKIAKKTVYRRLLMIYWLILPLLFVTYLVLKSQMLQLNMDQILIQEPHLSVMLLLALLTPLSSYVLRELSQQDQLGTSFAKLFFKFSIVQQLIVGNLIGGGLAYLAYKESSLPATEITKTHFWKGYLILLAQGMLTIIALLAFYSIFKNN